MAATVFVQMSRSQKVTLFSQATLNNKQAPLVSGPTWSIDNPLLATLRPSADGFTCDVVAAGTIGVCNVTCNAVGQTPVSVTTQVTIVTDYADTLSVTYGTVVPQ